MPPIPNRKPQSTTLGDVHNYTPERLLRWGTERITVFCQANSLTLPKITTHDKSAWKFGVCAFYRPIGNEQLTGRMTGINICLPLCARPAPVQSVREWSWPGAVTDRTPYGVLAHELGHHADWSTGERKWEYGSEYCESVMKSSKEKPLTSYCPDPGEWFAEMFRLFVTNHALLSMIRPKTWDILMNDWTPVSDDDWQAALGHHVPERILNAQLKR